MSDSDLDLLAAWRAGDAAAGNRLVRRHFDGIFAFFESRVGASAEELTQRTFMACVESRDRIREGSSFRAYLFGIARKHLLRLGRELARQRRLDPYQTGVGSVRKSSMGAALARAEQQRLLARALGSLPLELQITVELYYWEELGLSEIADATEVPVGTVKSRLYRARTLLRDAIGQMETETQLRDSTIEGFEAWAQRLAERDRRAEAGSDDGE